MKSNDVSNIFQVCNFYWPPASYIMIKQLTGKREWEEEVIFVRMGVHIFCGQLWNYYPTEVLASAQF